MLIQIQNLYNLTTTLSIILLRFNLTLVFSMRVPLTKITVGCNLIFILKSETDE